MRFVSKPTRRTELSGPERLRKRNQVRRAIFEMRQRLGDQTTCLHRAIAAQIMLRRRSISTTLYFGAAKVPGQGLSAHAWVQDGEEGVVGYRETKRNRYYIVATYPDGQQGTSFLQKSVPQQTFHPQSFYQQIGGGDGQAGDDADIWKDADGNTTPETHMGHAQL